MKKIALITLIIISGLLFAFKNHFSTKPSQPKTVRIGAYYYDGWSSNQPINLTKGLTDTFVERKPIWGWNTSEPAAMQGQIDEAANADISFFCFCWYFPNSGKTNYTNTPLNNAVKLFMQAPNNNRMNFSIMATNHQGFFIGPKDWPVVTKAWLSIFQHPRYLKVNNKPFLSFFSEQTLLKTFGSTGNVRKAFDSLRSLAKNAGLNGVSIAVCIPNANPKDIDDAKACGFDFITGYNSHGYGFKWNWQKKKYEAPIDSLISGNVILWNQFSKISTLPYIPNITLNWDPRPWATSNNIYTHSPSYTGYSANSIYSSVKSVVNWIKQHPQATNSSDPVAIMYAWNEYGEGGWLTPSVKLGDSYLKAVKRALTN